MVCVLPGRKKTRLAPRIASLFPPFCNFLFPLPRPTSYSTPPRPIPLEERTGDDDGDTQYAPGGPQGRPFWTEPLSGSYLLCIRTRISLSCPRKSTRLSVPLANIQVPEMSRKEYQGAISMEHEKSQLDVEGERVSTRASRERADLLAGFGPPPPTCLPWT